VPVRRPPRRGIDPRLVIGGAVAVVAVLAVAVIALSGSGGGGKAGATPSPAAAAAAATSSAATPAASATPAPSAAPGVAAGQPAEFPLALVAKPTDLRTGFTSAQVGALLRGGKVILPCGLSAVTLDGAGVKLPEADCVPADEVAARLAKTKSGLALLPPSLVDPRVKALTVDDADLFGNTVVRARPYPLAGRSDALPPEMAGTATVYDANDVRTVVSTGDTCPDRSVSLWAVLKKKGWDWTLQGGTARYTGTYMDRRFDGPTGNGWPVVKAVRTGEDEGAVWSMIHDADLAVNDFECPMIRGFTQHDSGTFFTIDPKVAGLMKRVGMDVLSLASNHITDLGADGINQTVDFLDKAGVQHAGAGENLAAAMKPAIVDVRGLKFAILSWDATGQSASATASRAGALKPTPNNLKKSIAKARAQADIVIAMPQWNWPEYSAPFSKVALAQRDAWFDAGVDHILGSGTHWASAMSVTEPDPAKGWRLAVTSHGNFLFGQDWSRQTQEGIVYEATFYGTRLAQVRLHPYIVMDSAQPSFTDPKTDGAYVLKQVYGVSDIP
jgi:poly-gamma-glutamate capsule biosynthesis protein CapA/YwtB (metallophosphatase superfamily)